MLPAVRAGEKVLGLLREAGPQVFEGYALQGGELEVPEHPGQDAATAELDPLLHSHPGEGLDDLDPADGRDHLVLEGLLDGLGAREHRPVYGTHYRDLWLAELHGVEDPTHLLARHRHVGRVGREGDVEGHFAAPDPGDCVSHGVTQSRDYRLAGGVVVCDHRALRLVEDPLDFLRVGPENGDHPARDLLRGLREKAISLGYEPEAGLEVEAPGGVGGTVLPERVPGHHVRAHLEDLALVGVLGGAGEELDLVRDALPDDAPDPRQEVGSRLRHPTTLSRKYERSHLRLANL